MIVVVVVVRGGLVVVVAGEPHNDGDNPACIDALMLLLLSLLLRLFGVFVIISPDADILITVDGSIYVFSCIFC